MKTTLRRWSAVLAGGALVGSAVLATAPAAQAVDTVTSVSKTGSNVGGYCSQAGGFQRNVYAPVATLRLTVSPSSPKAGTATKIKVFVKQRQATPAGKYYPARILRGEVVIGISGKSKALVGPVNAQRFTGAIFASGWTAKATVKAPAAGKHRITVKRIVYNVRGGGSGGWGKPYAGFDLVCSGGLNPSTTTTAYLEPRLTLKVRKP